MFLFSDCSDVCENGYGANGVCPIWLQRGYRFSLFYCDMETFSEVSNKTRWTVIQKRMNGEVNFEKRWDEYLTGFGNITGEHWVGRENIYSKSTMPDKIWIFYGRNILTLTKHCLSYIFIANLF